MALTPTLTVADIAKRLACSVDVVCGHINAPAGKPRLRAINIGVGRRRNYRIAEEWFAEFVAELAASAEPKARKPRRQRKREKPKTPPGFVDYAKKWGLESQFAEN